MPIGHDEIDLDGSACPEVFQDTYPALFALLGTGSQRQHFLVSLQVHAQGDEDHGRISLVSMTHAEMDAIQVENTPMLLQSALTPGGELLLQIAIEPTDGAGTGSHSHQRLGNFSDSVGTRASDKHLGESLRDLWLIAAVALEDLRVELALAISRDLQVFDPTRGGPQIALVETITIPFALGAALAPAHSDERVKLFAHHPLQHHAQGTAGQFA